MSRTVQVATAAVPAKPTDLTLTDAQIDQIISEAGGEDVAVLLSQLSEDALRDAIESIESTHLCQSLLRGLLIYTMLPDDGSDLGVYQLARTLPIKMSTVHRYISTLLAMGLIKRDPRSRRYRKA